MAYKYTKVWRIKNPDKRNEGKKKNYAKSGGHGNRRHYTHWTQEEKDLLANSQVKDFDLHQILGRSVQSIQVKRCRLRESDEIQC